MLKKSLAMMVLGVLALFCVGCNPMTNLRVTVDIEESFRQQLASMGGRTILVDVVAISPAEHQRWHNYSMTKYWEANDPMRESQMSRIKTLSLDPAKPEAQTIAKDDPIWKKWREGANDKAPPKLYVLAKLPKPTGGAWSQADDRDDGQDPRRQILPLGSARWASTDVKLQVTKTSIMLLTQPKPDKGGQ